MSIQTPTISECKNPACKETFKFRSNKQCCSPKCKMVFLRSKNLPENRENSVRQKRRENEVFQLSYDLAERFYKLPNNQKKLNLCLEILSFAASGDTQYRQALTAPQFLKPDHKKASLFFCGNPAYRKTFAEIVNSLCLRIFGRGTSAVLKRGEYVPRQDVNLKSIDMSLISKRGAKPSGCQEAVTPNMIYEEMEGRPARIIDYYMRIVEFSDVVVPIAENP